MAVRATKTKVGKLVDLDDAIDVAPFIEAANSVVDAVCLESGYSDAKLTIIENWLSAHFYQILDQPNRFEGAGKVQYSVMSKVDLGLDLTHHGQMAKLLDTDGNLAALDAATKGDNAGTHRIVKPSIGWLGTTRE